MTLWVVRAGKTGDREQQALEQNCCFIGWTEITDLNQFSTKEDLKIRLFDTYPESSRERINNHAGQIWNFYKSIKKDDLIALPLKHTPAIAIGRVIGDYEYNPNNPKYTEHFRRVKWLGEPILRSALEQDLLYSFGSTLTVFSIKRNDAEKRIESIINGTKINNQIYKTSKINDEIHDEQNISLIDMASEQISVHIGRHFKGRKMEVLIEEILKAKGYETNLCDEGADGGVDILASYGAMGFSEPLICVQVKSSDYPIGREILDQLTGVMQRYKATHAILVSWGGFKPTVIKEARRDFFKIRLWNDKKIVEELLEAYDLLPRSIQIEIPLQRIWALSNEEN